MKTLFRITKEECHFDLFHFYEHIARATGEKITDKTLYDCRKIRTTTTVQAEIWSYYLDNGFDNESIAQMFLVYGPKANLLKDGYFVEIEDGFVCQR